MIDQRIAELNAPYEAALGASLGSLETSLERTSTVTPSALIDALDFSVAAPSWAVGTGGTRFGRFPWAVSRAPPRRRSTTWRRSTLSPPATGRSRSTSPGTDPDGLRQYAAALDRVRCDELEHLPGQPGHDPRRRHHLQVRQSGQRRPDGAGSGGGAQSQCDRPRGASRVAGADRLAGGQDKPPRAGGSPDPVRGVAEGLQQVRPSPDDWRMYKHKPYEPAFYATVNNDWGSSLPAGAGGR